MKKTILILFLLSAKLTFGQSGPTCNDFVVENLTMENDSTMRITIRNNYNMNWGAYCDVMVIQNSIDTIANTNCTCLFGPAPDTLSTYFLPSNVATVPLINQLRVSMSCVCDTIPLSPTLGINLQTRKETIFVFPNPSSNNINIQNNSTQAIQFSLYNSLGEKIIDKILTNKTSTINLSACVNDIYFYKASNDKQEIKSGKIVKQ